MEEILQVNEDALKKHRPYFYDRLGACAKNKGEDLADAVVLDNIETLQAKDGTNVLSVQRQGKTYRLNSRYRPQEEAKKWCSQYAFQNLRVTVILFGLGNGLFAKKLLQCAAPDASVFIVEPSAEIFFHVIATEDLTDIFGDKRVYLYLDGLNGEDFFQDLLKATHWSNMKTQIDCVHPGYEKLFPKAYQTFCARVKECCEWAIVNKNTNVYFSEKIEKNTLGNLKYIPQANDWMQFVGAFPKDLPVIIVAAGPSLDKNKEQLRRAKDKALIVAVDTAVRHLLAADIPFDCTVSVDPGKPDSYLMQPGCKDVPLFCVLATNGRIMDYHKGKKIWYGDMGGYLNSLYQKYHFSFTDYPCGSGVATTAFATCRMLGFTKYILVGQDLAYGQGDVTHAGNKTSGIRGEKRKIFMVEGIDGKPVKTRGDWKAFLDWFEREIALSKKDPEFRVVDATEGGAKIAGTEIMTLSDAIDALCTKKVDVGKIFADKEPRFAGKSAEIKKELLHIENEFRGIRQKAKQAQENAEKALQLIGEDITSMEAERYIKEMVKANSFIYKQRVYGMVDIFIEKQAYETLQEVNVMTGDQWQDRKKSVENALDLYKALSGAVKDLQPTIDEALERIRKL